MADIASLIVRVKGEGVGSTTAGLSSLTGAAVKATGAITGLASAGAALSKLVSVSRQTDVLKASLVTMTGSMANANAAFDELSKFAASTPYALDQSVTAFTKLVSLGLTPSQKALTAYGNTAAAMGKDLNQMIEAVADATTGEFERLKEFGIKASQQGDKVSFTFQGVTTTVAKNSAAIEGYLQGIGENNFAGAMANRMATLDGAISNLSDSWDGLFRAISSQGAGGIIQDQVISATKAVNELSAAISSGQALGLITAWGVQWEDTTKDVKSAINDASIFINQKLMDFGLSAEESSSLMSDAFWQFPANIRAMLQVATVEVAGFVDKTKVWAEALKPENWLLTIDEFKAKYQSQFDAIDQNVIDTNSVFLAERDKRISKLQDEITKANDLRAAYDNDKTSIDLSQFSKAAPASSTGSNATDAQMKQAAAYLEQLRQANLTELQLIDAQNKEKQAKLNELLNLKLITEEQYLESIYNIDETSGTDRYNLKKDMLDKELRLRNEYAQYFGDVGQTEFDKINEREQMKLDMLKGYREKGLINEESYQEKISQINSDYALERMKTTGDEFGKMAANMKTSLGEASGAYKAFAIVQATIATYTGAIEAYKSASAIPFVGWVMGPVAAAAAVAAGVANIAKIRSAREQGGAMVGGSAYQMAERGKAEVIVPAGSSRARTAAQMRDIMGQNSGGAQAVTIINQTTGRVDNVQTEQRSDGQLLVTISEYISDQFFDPDSRISKARRATA